MKKRELVQIIMNLFIILILHELGHIIVGELFLNWKFTEIIFIPNTDRPNVLLNMFALSTDYTNGYVRFSAFIIGLVLAPLLFVSVYLITKGKSWHYWLYSLLILRGDIYALLAAYNWCLEYGLLLVI